jgi:hypothetical protein
VDPTRRGPDWMKITPAAGSLFHEKEHLSATHPIGSSRKSASMVPAATTPPNEMRCQDMEIPDGFRRAWLKPPRKSLFKSSFMPSSRQAR